MLLSACEPVTEVMGLLHPSSKNLIGSYLMINVFPSIITQGRLDMVLFVYMYMYVSVDKAFIARSYMYSNCCLL